MTAANCECFTNGVVGTYKNSPGGCFACRGELSGIPKLLTAGVLYPACSPLVEGATKADPWLPMTAPDECIVGFVGDCAIDATGWAEDCKAPVYDDVIAIKQCVNWPEDAEGNQLFTVEDVEAICQGHHCCIRFINQVDCVEAPAWIKEINGEAALK